MMSRTSFVVGLFLLIGVQLASAQATPPQEQPAKKARPKQELKISEAAISGSYVSEAVQRDTGAPQDPTSLDPYGMLTGLVGVDWRKESSKSYLTASSRFLYGVRLQDKPAGDWNEALSVLMTTNTREAKRKVTVSGIARVLTFDEALFLPHPYTAVVSADTGYQELASAVLRREFVNPALASTNEFQTGTPAESFQFGRRTAHGNVSTTLSIAPSRRLRLEILAGTRHERQLEDKSDVIVADRSRFTSGLAGASLRYSLTPRTQIGLSTDGELTRSPQFRNTAITGKALVTHLTRQRWFFEASAGVGHNSVRDRSLTATYSGGIGFKTLTHSFMAFTTRDVGDSYALAFGQSEAIRTMSTGAWHWNTRQSLWWIDSSVSYSRERALTEPSHVWLTLETVGIRAGRDLALMIQASAGRVFSQRLGETPTIFEMSANAFRVSLRWSPPTGLVHGK